MLEQKEVNFKNAVEYFPVPLALLDSQWNTIYLNDKFTDVYGYTLSDVPSLDKWWQVAYPDDGNRDKMLDQWDGAVKNAELNGVPISPIENFIRCKNGSMKEIKIHFSKMENGFNLAVFSDITKRKDAEKELSERKLKYQELYKYSPLGYHSLDTKGCFIDVNPAWLELLGYSYEDVKGKWFGDFLKASEVPAFRSDFGSYFEKGCIGPYYYHMRNKAGNLILIELRGNIGYDSAGDLAQTHCIIQDVTERQRSHDELKKEKENAQHYLDIVDVMIIASDINIKVTLVNKKGCKVLGYSEDELLGINGFELCVPGNYRSIYGEYFAKVVSGSIGEVCDVELPILTKNGDERLIRWQVTPLRENGTIVGVLTSGNDVTERKMAENALILDESRLEALVELNHMNNSSVYDITHFALEKAVDLTCSQVGYIGFVNKDESVISIHSWSQNAMDRCNITYLPTEYFVKDAGLWAEPVRERKAVISNDLHSNISNRYPAGHISISSHLGVPVLDDGKVVSIVGVGNKKTDYNSSDIRQITLLMEGLWKIIKKRQDEGKLKKYAEELARKNNELASLDILKDEFLSNITHELKTPLISIKGYSDLLLEGHLGQLNDEQNKGMISIVKGSERLQRLIDSILCLQDLNSGNMDYNTDVIFIKDLIEKVLYDMNLIMGPKIGAIQMDISGSLPLLSGNSAYLEQVFFHIIDNAQKFTSNSDDIKISIQPEGENIHAIVEDSGIGISEDQLPHIFTRFYQADGSRERKYGGNGIGLHLCKSIVEAHGGSMWAESEQGVGTKIHVVLPFSGKCQL